MTTYEIISNMLFIIMTFNAYIWYRSYKREEKRRIAAEIAAENHPIIKATWRIINQLSQKNSMIILSNQSSSKMSSQTPNRSPLAFAEEQLKKALENEEYEVAEQIKKDIEDLKRNPPFKGGSTASGKEGDIS